MHLGSLVTATASYLDVRSRGGRWLLRLEDLDRAREVAGAAAGILRTLEAFGFEWDGPVTYQSRRTEHYRAALQRLVDAGLAYPCSCTRSDLAGLPRGPDGEAVYPGTCRRGAKPGPRPPAWRFRTDLPGSLVEFIDEIQGPVSQRVDREVGDFVILRRDGFFAYQLAVVTDDADQAVNRVVRGCDLLDNTPRQILLQRSLGLPQPAYAHVPLVTEPGGGKLSKSQRAIPLDPAQAPGLLVAALRLLRQEPPRALEGAPIADTWCWALGNWRPERLSGTRTLPATQ